MKEPRYNFSTFRYPNCTAEYPEKPKEEVPRQLFRVDLGDGEYVMQCGDCGAYTEVLKDDE